MGVTTGSTHVPQDLAAAFATERELREAFDASAQGRYAAAMEIAWNLGLEQASVARAAMDLARKNWESGQALYSGLADDVSKGAALAMRAGVAAAHIARSEGV